MLVAVLGFLGVGTLALPYLDSKRREEIFPSGQPDRPAVTAPDKRALVADGPTQAQGRSEDRQSPVEPYGLTADGRIDLNTATAEVLDTLPGVGPSRAAAIIALRNRKGGFRSVEELDEVPGIGLATMAKLRPLVTVSTVPGAGPQVQPPTGTQASPGPPVPGRGGAFQGQPPGLSVANLNPRTPVPSAGQAPVLQMAPSSAGASPGEYTGPVNINTAGPEQLVTLKYIGPRLAEAIIAHRTRYGPFRRPEDLEAVKGIGRRVIEANRGRIVVN